MENFNLEERYICALQDFTGETNSDRKRFADGIERLLGQLVNISNLHPDNIVTLCDCLEAAAKEGKSCKTLKRLIEVISKIDFEEIDFWIGVLEEE